MAKRILLAIIVVMALVAGALYFAVTQWKSRSKAEVEIAAGSSVHKIAGELASKGVIRMPTLFELLVRVRGTAGKLRAGTYDFDEGTTLLLALSKIERGDVRQYPLKIIEGWTIKEIAAAITGQPYLASPEVPAEFVRLASDPNVAAQFGFQGSPSLEGYLFPDTYFVARPLSAEGLIRRLVGHFQEVRGTLDKQMIANSGLSQPQIVTLASIVEKETGAKEERPLIASVFFNRLKLGMPLQSDPTIIYGLADYNGNIRKSDITNPHPYNTYVHAGLPPGPICNPGKASLDAVISPAQSSYLFFVSMNNGTHKFSENLVDHSRAVQEYQVEGKNK